MLFDMQEVSLDVGMIPFPDFPFAALERPASQMQDTSYIRGNDTSDSSVGGSVD